MITETTVQLVRVEWVGVAFFFGVGVALFGVLLWAAFRAAAEGPQVLTDAADYFDKKPQHDLSTAGNPNRHRPFSSAYAGHGDLDVSLKMDPRERSHDIGPADEPPLPVGENYQSPATDYGPTVVV